ncbi:hypothetical protein GCK72_013508 [Caenorhabditis remanei]|uniref:Uncharacterized protein n=1 Tax=Caenorhabditis remanei TaxID=31234 RepID=A0A6A5GR33_CAERE|nr:hypothetical protein GCK72_013508 [Caenorhabditis remanei]KAF1757053.1 hypothetical protein GCK72_013508 [Caenorhabditis remanei]
MGEIKKKEQLKRRGVQGPNPFVHCASDVSILRLLCPCGLLLLLCIFLVHREFVLVDNLELSTEIDFGGLLLLQFVELSFGLRHLLQCWFYAENVILYEGYRGESLV